MTAYDDAVLVDGPAAYWKLDEDHPNASSWADASGNSRPLDTTEGSGTRSNQDPMFPSSVRSVGLDGSIALGHSSAVLPPFAEQPVSLEFWLRHSGSTGTVFGSRTGPGAGFDRVRCQVWNNGDLSITIGGDSNIFAGAGVVTSGVDHHVVVTYEPDSGTPTQGTVRFYVDGQEVFSDSYTPAGQVTSNWQAWLGMRAPGLGGNLTGRIDHVAIYPGVLLSAARVEAHFDAAFATAGPPWQLTVDTNGEGTVTVDPDLPEYDDNDPVDLTAVPATGWTLGTPLWSGDVPSGDENDQPLTLVMDDDKTVTANFEPLAPTNVQVVVTEPGKAEVTWTPVQGATAHQVRAEVRAGFEEGNG